MLGLLGRQPARVRVGIGLKCGFSTGGDLVNEDYVIAFADDALGCCAARCSAPTVLCPRNHLSRRRSERINVEYCIAAASTIILG
ncbi:MAG: hypothetical protein ACM4D3_15565 [Candidatus Sericytochromatia bacterium]